jgi:CheY-like chemotaxis protein
MNSPLSFENASSSQLGTILVVDDEPSILAIASAILNTVSSTPLKASNGEEAIEVMEAEYLAGRTITTAIVDLTMPGGLSGFETMEGLKKIDSNIKVIACSGYFQEGALELCQSIGFANILAKPYTPDSFISMIRRTKGEFSASDRPTPAKPLAEAPSSPPPSALPSQVTTSPITKPSTLVRSALAKSLKSQRTLDTPTPTALPQTTEPVNAPDTTSPIVTSSHAE